MAFFNSAVGVLQTLVIALGAGLGIWGVVNLLLVALLFIVMLAGSINSMAAMFTGVNTTVMQSTYLASDDELKAAEEAYCEMEEALQRQIDNIESHYPGYDEYRYQVDEISHNPYQLASYLTVKFGNFKASDAKVQKELKTLFKAQYGITIDGGTETITETKTVKVGESLGQVVTSGYCNCSICCGRWAGGATASGAYPTANHTIAVDASNPTVPMGTKVIMNGVEYTVEDTGNFARYGVDFDVYYDSHSAASAHGHQTWEAYLADDNGTQEVEVTTTRTVTVLNTTMTNGGFDAVARARLSEDDAINWYNILNTSYGNRDYLWDKTTISGYTTDGMSYSIPAEALSDARFKNMITEAEKYLGYPYVWGGASPSTSFDCSGFVSWVINNCGNGWNVGRLTAEGLRTSCTYVSPDQAKPGDLIFFQGTYDTAGASHVGIYVGNGMMIHCGNPIQYDVDDEDAENMQFMTVTTRDGSYYYIIIDRSGSEDNVYFLNAVDAADLMNVMTDEEKEELAESASSETEDSSTDIITPTIVDDDSQADGDATDADAEDSDTDSQTKTTSALPMLGVFAFIGAMIAGAYYLLKIKPEKEQAKDVDEDREFYDDDEYVNEDEWLDEDDEDGSEGPKLEHLDADDFPDADEFLDEEE